MNRVFPKFSYVCTRKQKVLQLDECRRREKEEPPSPLLSYCTPLLVTHSFSAPIAILNRFLRTNSQRKAKKQANLPLWEIWNPLGANSVFSLPSLSPILFFLNLILSLNIYCQIETLSNFYPSNNTTFNPHPRPPFNLQDLPSSTLLSTTSSPHSTSKPRSPCRQPPVVNFKRKQQQPEEKQMV